MSAFKQNKSISVEIWFNHLSLSMRTLRWNHLFSLQLHAVWRESSVLRYWPGSP